MKQAALPPETLKPFNYTYVHAHSEVEGIFGEIEDNFHFYNQNLHNSEKSSNFAAKYI